LIQQEDTEYSNSCQTGYDLANNHNHWLLKSSHYGTSTQQTWKNASEQWL